MFEVEHGADSTVVVAGDVTRWYTNRDGIELVPADFLAAFPGTVIRFQNGTDAMQFTIDGWEQIPPISPVPDQYGFQAPCEVIEVM